MDTLTLACARREKDLIVAELCEANTLGIIEEELPDGRWRLQAFFASGDGLESQFAAWNPVRGAAGDTDWVGLAQAAWQPQAVGERFFLVPSWREDDAPPGRLRLEMPPGTASGTGLHPCTQLALRAMERLIRPGNSFLDLGTGSGILSAGAHLLGARPIIACDIDQEALAAARDYLHYTRVPAGLFAGSCRSLGGRSIDVAVANISVSAIEVAAGSLAACLKAGGRAFLTGFAQAEASRISGHLASASLRVEDTLTVAEWGGLTVALEG
ncbi:MAG TPA: 50S ribosomal protein L11 methyltransferase [Bryobacteraceae bacterium]|nr:50S ribosomal protein L11 methyltransferase [Bryobacteraceae bacterium]